MSRLLTSAAGLVCTLLAACGGGSNGGGASAGDAVPTPAKSASCWTRRASGTCLRAAAGRRRRGGLVRDGRRAARRADCRSAGRGQGPLFQLRDHAPGRRRHPPGRPVHRVRVPLADRGRPVLAHRRLRGQSRPRRGASARHGDHARSIRATAMCRWPRCSRRTRTWSRPLARPPRASSAASGSCSPGGAPPKPSSRRHVVIIRPCRRGARVLALPSNPTVPVGYLSLRTFITTAEAPLREAYADFRAQGIEYFIVDLRYNGGGLVRIAELIGDLNGQARSDSDVYLGLRSTSAKSRGRDSRAPLPAQAESVAPVRIAFITTGLTASASEIVINSLAPWTEVAIVGDDTLRQASRPIRVRPLRLRPRLRLISLPVHQRERPGRVLRGIGQHPALRLPRGRRPDAGTGRPGGRPRPPRRSPGWGPAPAREVLAAEADLPGKGQVGACPEAAKAHSGTGLPPRHLLSRRPGRPAPIADRGSEASTKFRDCVLADCQPTG